VGGDAPSYGKSNVQTNDAGNYFVTVANSFGSVDSRNATLTVTNGTSSISPPSPPVPTSLKSVGKISPAPVTPPALSLVHSRSKKFGFTFPSSAGATYEVQYKENITDPDWTTLATNIGTGEWITNELPMTNETSGFFRVLAK
jgi:hypothetical protein